MAAAAVDYSKEFTEAEVTLLHDLFTEFDDDKSGEVDVNELAKMVESLGMVVGKAQVDAWLKVRASADGSQRGWPPQCRARSPPTAGPRPPPPDL